MDLGMALERLRGLCYEPPSHRVWLDICALIDACPEESVEVAIDYAIEHMGRWPKGHHILEDLRPEGFDPRVAPKAWVASALADPVKEGRLRMARGIALTSAHIANTRFREMASGGALSGVGQVTLDVVFAQAFGWLIETLPVEVPLSKVDRLSIRGEPIGHWIVGALDRLSARLPSLTRLDLASCEVNEPAMQAAIQKPLAGRLIGLDLRPMLLGAGLEGFFEGAHPEMRLRELGLALGKIEGASRVLGAAQLEDLEVLRLRATDQGSQGIARAFGVRPWLRLAWLDLSHSALGDEGGAALIGALEAPSLKTLAMKGCGLGHRSVGAMAGAEGLGGLESVSLDHNGVDDEGVRALLKGSWGALEALSLSSNPLGDGAAEAIAQADVLPSLERLDLSRTSLTDEGAAILARSAPHLSSLTSLNIEQTRVTRRGLRAMIGSPYLGVGIKEGLSSRLMLSIK